tara:strand:- start:1074 stop:2255 length:1182 start_codon:yes stop_codon:yes gene_type:complete
MLQNNSSKKIGKATKQFFNYKESWRYTNIIKLQKINYLDEDIITNKIKTNNIGIDIINNTLINNKINDKQIFTDNLSNAIENNLFGCANHFDKIIPENKNEFILNNKTYFKKGFFLNLDDDTNIKDPIYLNNLIDTNNLESFLNFRYLLQFGKNNNAKIILKNSFIKKLKLNSVIEVLIDENSTVDIIIESESENVTQILNFAANIKTNAKLNIYTINISGELIRNNYFIDLNNENSYFNYYGINLLSEKNHIDDFVEIKHKKNYTYSDCIQKNILCKNSKAIFYNKTIIDKNGANSEANQSNQNIMLSSTATVHSNPQLEIYNNDVKCSHGSTTGQLDSEMLFYLQSRGINLEQSKMMLLAGFLNEFINSLNMKDYPNYLMNKINSWLNIHD